MATTAAHPYTSTPTTPAASPSRESVYADATSSGPNFLASGGVATAATTSAADNLYASGPEKVVFTGAGATLAAATKGSSPLVSAVYGSFVNVFFRSSS